MTLEKDIERRLRVLVERHDGLCLKWVCPGWAGVPDRIVLLPGGRVVFVELKQPNGRLGALQKWWRDQLRQFGFKCWVIWDEANLEMFEECVLRETL